MKIKFFIFLTLGLLLPAAIAAKTDASKLLIVTEHMPPFQMKVGNELTGFTTDIIRAALALTPYNYELALYPWSRSYNIASKKENACIYSMARTKEREKLFQWTTPISITNSSFVGLAANKAISLNSIEDAKKYHTAVLKDDFTQQYLLKHGFIVNKNLFIVDNPDSFLKLLITRSHIDLILTDKITLNYRAKYNQIDPKIFQDYLRINHAPIKFYLACSNKTAPDIIATLSTAINSIKNNGRFRKIAEKWRYNNIEAVLKQSQ
ncbi:transporter substrate-binding domain-containing protein [Thalassomonas actiniarum]|uniref:Transporter substrate-binding domain-containing protein n=1 Tax=Thalassomonas actiniarum TaxID=485447 RepID=A0AAE9YVE7_9GAMM|nr:transporter substrate-binding domain-containing protein [Thalassomonas actiniarum]WDE01044.1 transporter substrate-binding domain-containing protein [Thalassomonas actiniarum]